VSKPRIFADLHHGDLFESYQLTFTDRMGWDVYAPIGMDYYDQNYWVFGRAEGFGDTVAQQYLTPLTTDRDCGDHWERDDWQHPGRTIKYLTLEQLRAMRPEVVLCSLWANEAGYYKLAADIGAKFGIHCGNQGSPNNFSWANFAMLSTTRPELDFKPVSSPLRPDLQMPCAFTTYHQEFDIKNLYTFHYPPEERDTVCTWVQVLRASEVEQARFVRLAGLTPELRWFTHGHDQLNPFWRCNAKDTPEVARMMQACRVGYNCKLWSDGFGHSLYALYSVGKPVISTAGYYWGRTDGQPKLAGELMTEDTVFDVQSHTDAEAVEHIRRLVNDEEYYFARCTAAYNRFKACVNFDEDAARIKAMIEGVLT